MFEFQIIKRYLIPSKTKISNSFISNISILTIALTVWLLIVFLSILKGVEKNWITKLTTLQAPIRLIPNEHYFQSDYFTQDGESPDTFFQYKTLFEKQEEEQNNESIVPNLIQILKEKNLSFDTYEVAAGVLKIQLSKIVDGRNFESYITQASYLTNPPIHSVNFQKILTSLNQEDLNGLKKIGDLEKVVPFVKDNVLYFPKPIKNLEPILLPKNFKESGVKAGDLVELTPSTNFSLTGATPHIMGYVCGFYDPGLMSVGTRVAFFRQEFIQNITNPEQASSIDPLLKGGFFVYIKEINKVKSLVKQLRNEKIMKYFDVVPFYEFAFAKEIMNQFQADQILFALIGFAILSIACLNIIAALLLIVQEKRQEIGLLMALGASKTQIQRIFGTLGFLIGFAGFLIGTFLAIITLINLESIVNQLLFLKGHPIVKSLSFEEGSALISPEIIAIALIITPILAMIAGIIPARKALKIEPIEILKNG